MSAVIFEPPLTHQSPQLIHLSGQPTSPAIDVEPARDKVIFNVNLWEAIQMVHAFIPLLISAASTSTSAPKSGARIVQIGSTAGVVPIPFTESFSAIYNASNAALHSYSNTLRVELAPFAVPPFGSTQTQIPTNQHFCFSVKMTSVIASGVQTNIDMRLSTSIRGSLYRRMEDIYQVQVAATRNTGHSFISLGSWISETNVESQ